MWHRIGERVKEYFDMVFRDSFTLMHKSRGILILFELLYKLVLIAVFYPVFLLGFRFTLWIQKIPYLTNNHLYDYLKSPFTIIFLLLIIVFLALYTTYEVFCLSICFDACHHGIKIGLVDVFKIGALKMRRALKKGKINTLFHITACSLMMNSTLLGFMISLVDIPDSATDVIKKMYYIIIPAGVLILLFFVYCLRLVFTANFLAYEENNIKESKKKSVQLLRRRGIKTFFVMLGWNILIAAAIACVYLLLIVCVCIVVEILDLAHAEFAIFLSAFRITVTLSKIAMALLYLPVSYGVITSMFYRYQGDNGKSCIQAEELSKPKGSFRFKNWITAGIIAAAVVLDGYYVVDAFDNNPFEQVQYLNETQVMAHRGSSGMAPENTMMAFEAAYAATADYIELDVHETADGVIVVIHDANLKRTTGVNRYVWDMDYAEIRELDAGSWFAEGEEYEQCYIPTLEEVLEYAKGKIKLNIEIKLSTHEPGLVKGVAELIDKYHFQEDCYVTSMDDQALRQIKAYDNTIRTGYVLMTAYGAYYKIDYIDAISINSAYVNKNLVDAVHGTGKKIFVWTVNKRSQAKRFVQMGVDAIITDDPVMGREVAFARYSNTLFGNVISYVFD